MNTVQTLNLYITLAVVLVILAQTILPGKNLTAFLMRLTLNLTQGGKMHLNGIERKYKGVGLAWNAIAVFLFHTIPGFIAAFLFFGIIKIISIGLNIPKDNDGYIFVMGNNFLWAIITLVCIAASSIKLSGSISIPELNVGRLEVKGRGIVSSKKNEIIEFQTIEEVEELWLPFFASVSSTLISLKPYDISSGQQRVVSGGTSAIFFDFSAQTRSEKPGLTFNSLEEKSNSVETFLKNNLVSVLTDLFQNLDIGPIFSMTSDEVYSVLYYPERDVSKLKNTKGSDFFNKDYGTINDEPTDSIERIFWKFVFYRQQTILLKFSPEKEKLFEANKKREKPLWRNGPKSLDEFTQQKDAAYAELEKDFSKFKQAIVSSLGTLLKKDRVLGMRTSALAQKVLIFADKKAQEAFEAEVLARYQILADDLQLDWLNEQIEELRKLFTEMPDKDLGDFILVSIGKIQRTITDYNWNTTGSKKGPQPVINVGKK